MRGAKPKPTHLKLLQGNPGRRPINLSEPKPEGDLSDAPAHLTSEQRLVWEYAIANAPMGLLKKLDSSALLVWVVASDMHRTASEAVAKFGMVTKTKAGEPVQNPYLPIVNRQAVLMLKAAAELGFTPSSRSRVSVSETPGATNRFEQLGHRPPAKR